jgi:hypothetical protein
VIDDIVPRRCHAIAPAKARLCQRCATNRAFGIEADDRGADLIEADQRYLITLTHGNKIPSIQNNRLISTMISNHVATVWRGRGLSEAPSAFIASKVTNPFGVRRAPTTGKASDLS